jgi:hypothetical protein
MFKGDVLTEEDFQTHRLLVGLVDRTADSRSYLYVHLYPTIHQVPGDQGSMG